MGRLRCALLPGFTIPDDVTIVATWTDREQGTHWIVLEGDALPAWCPQMDALIVPTSEVSMRLIKANKAIWNARADVWTITAVDDIASDVAEAFRPAVPRRP